jgi:predicted O-methyltransferase YrrM
MCGTDGPARTCTSSRPGRPRCDKDPIDILFIDAEKGGYDAYLKELLPYVRPGGLIIAHNMRRPAPNQRYVEAITTSPNLDTSFVLMDGAGIGITLKKR